MPTVILGGGISGLTAAYYLLKKNCTSIALLEASNRFGGWIKSNKQKNDSIFEEGPRTIRPRGNPGINTLNLIDDLGLSENILPIKNDSAVARNRMIYAGGELHSLPNTFSSLLKVQKPFSKPLLMHLLQDLVTKPKIVKDESIYNFTRRRFGDEVAEYLISPLIRGICAGNAQEVSVNFLMKKLFDYEQKYGSISKGIVKHVFNKNTQIPKGKLAKKALEENWNVYSFRNGLETLPIKLETFLSSSTHVNLCKNFKVSEIKFKKNGALIKLDDGHSINYSHVISSLSAKTLAPLINNQHPQLASMLNNIKFVTVGVINLEFKGHLIESPGFGFLVPPKEKLSILGVIYDSCCHSYQNTVLTVMMGGYWFESLFGENPINEDLLKIALKDVKTTLQINSEPINYKVNILRDCIPQYIVGHQENLHKIETYIKTNNLPLSLCGSSYYGIGVNDVILSSKNVVENVNFSVG
ncbi:protoporphyrinogen oxidase isoform X1 [Rhynchophorus ferrugineus]|uniref:protoporphyrinogen oxidase isoform X1 n=1 Tax=Rhynchophorus ferrugineus TaxID=354439 RepID=UPI003FCD16CB